MELPFLQSLQQSSKAAAQGYASLGAATQAPQKNLLQLPPQVSGAFKDFQNFSNAAVNVSIAPGTEVIKPFLMKAGAPSGVAAAAGVLGDIFAPGPGGKAKEATSVLSYITKAGEKVFTKITPQELSVLRDEVKHIPAALPGLSQIHLDPFNSRLQEVAKEVPRHEFTSGHPQAPIVFRNSLKKSTTVNAHGRGGMPVKSYTRLQ